jgi:predicted Fe-Mo cluster-binding NifX family protein
MKLALATEDREHIARRTGRAAEFAIYHIVDGKLIHVEYLKNDHNRQESHEHNHEQAHSHANVVAAFKGVDLFLVTHLGPHFKAEIEAAKIPYEIVRENLIEDLLRPYLITV